jgi:hypothetical protein
LRGRKMKRWDDWPKHSDRVHIDGPASDGVACLIQSIRECEESRGYHDGILPRRTHSQERVLRVGPSKREMPASYPVVMESSSEVTRRVPGIQSGEISNDRGKRTGCNAWIASGNGKGRKHSTPDFLGAP